MKALRVYVVGIVQGVGFRPYVEHLARRLGLAGYVRNLGGGEVEIYVEGEGVDEFLEEFKRNRPAAIAVEELKAYEETPKGLTGFKIIKSSEEAREPSAIPPDLAICDDCLAEFKDARNRRSRYLFISCSWCGPRFALIKRLPYDRPNTSWSRYGLCPECEREYSSLEAGGLRRYFYQGISCPQCGPRVVLRDGEGKPVLADDPVAEAAELIEEGNIVAVKGFGGFHLAALASDDDVVLRLRERKRRPQQPFAVMALESAVGKLVYLDGEAFAMLRSPQRPILLLPKREDSPASKYVSPGLAEEGVLLPYSALHYYLLERVEDRFLVMTSGNVHGRPMCKDMSCALRELKGIADYFLDHGLEIAHRVDDSVLRRTNGRWVFLRRGRGYAPVWLKSPIEFKRPVVAFGAELANAGAVAFGSRVVPTQYIGDTDDFDALMELDRELRWFAEVYKIKEPVLACDLNPSYSSTWLCLRWAEEIGAEAARVQHHHAHALAAALEYGEAGPFTAITIDGVGYGLDGSAWGGEVLEVYGAEFKRIGHLRPVPMPGGDAAAVKPIRMAAAFLYAARGADGAETLLRKIGAEDAHILVKLASSAALYTTSLGRFLDAVSSALGIAKERTYEGEPAMKLEAAARGGRPLPIEPHIRGNVVDTAELFAELLEAYLSGAPRRDVAYTAQYAVGKALGEVACAGGGPIYVSGGAAVNDYVVKGIEDACGSVKLPRLTPPGDGGIAVGQAYYAVLL
jgi:hydrogenase maturation protein HypF